MITPVAETERVEIANELIAALRAAQHERAGVDAGGAMTTGQLAEQLGWCNDRVRAMLRTAIASGEVQAVKVRVANIAGSYSRVAAYRFVGQPAGNGNGHDADH